MCQRNGKEWRRDTVCVCVQGRWDCMSRGLCVRVQWTVAGRRCVRVSGAELSDHGTMCPVCRGETRGDKCVRGRCDCLSRNLWRVEERHYLIETGLCVCWWDFCRVYYYVD